VRAARYPALSPVVLATALDRYRELPGQAKKQPEWPTKKIADAVAKQLRVQAAAAAAPGAAAGAAHRGDA
jgi:hypothetical protein